MTVSANSDFNLTVAQVVKQGLQQAGVLPLGQEPRPDQQADVRSILAVRLSELQAKGVLLASTERKDLTLSANVSTYSLDSDTVDVTGDGMVKVAGAVSQTQVLQFPWANYQMLTSKDTTGTPTQMYVEKQASVSIVVWPVPTQAMTLSYRRIRLLRNVDSGGVTPDVWARQLRLLVLYVAHDLAMAGNLPLNKIAYLGAQVAAAERTALRDSEERGDLQFYMEVR